MFDTLQVKNEIVQWIRDQFKGTDHKAIIGISGGKDSSVAAALCVEALGRERVFGVLMPNGEQSDIDYSKDLCQFLGIQYAIINIADTVNSFMTSISDATLVPSSQITTHFVPNSQAVINTPPRIRMTTLYAMAAILGGRVIGTSNLSEIYIGYSTKWGDGVSDLNPLGGITCTEVIAIGRLILPSKFVEKPPADGLTNKTDEDNFGFTYDELDWYIREKQINNEISKQLIDKMHENSAHKRWLPIYYPIIIEPNTTGRPKF